MREERIIVVGGNAAGPAAAAKAKRTNPEAKVTILEKGNYISTGTCEMPYVLSGDISNPEDLVFYNPEKLKEDKGVEVLLNHKVEEINSREKYVIADDFFGNRKRKFEYDKLILCTGSLPNKVKDVPEGENIFTFTSIHDLIKIDDYLKHNKVSKVAIIGSGYIGLELTEAFIVRGLKVFLIEKLNAAFPTAEKETQQLFEKLLERKGVYFYKGFEKMKIAVKEGRGYMINIDERLLETDLIISATGVVPNNEIAAKAGLNRGEFGGLSVDKKLKTSDDHIFAAGDNIEIINALTNKKDYLPLATIAYNYGHVAGENAAGGHAYAEPVIKNISVKFFENFYSAVGLSSSEAEKENFKIDTEWGEGFNIVKIMPGSDKVYGKIIFDKESRRLYGGEFFGGKEVSGYADVLSALIREQKSVDYLEKLDFNYTPTLSPLVNLLQILGKKVRGRRSNAG
jgi:NADPH-dependent 2,4-dienoyl-CoA reductase/sulfur reductase-like enzyme